MVEKSDPADGRIVAVREPGGSWPRLGVCSLERGPLPLVVVIDGCPIGELPAGACLRLGATALARLAVDRGVDAPGARATSDEGGGLVEGDAGDPVPAEILEPGTVTVGDPVRLEVVVIPLGDVLDLHSFRPEETAAVVAEYIHEARQAGLDEVRIVHGRGRGVQRAIVRRVLAEAPGVTQFADASPARGGWGATIVQLRPIGPATPT